MTLTNIYEGMTWDEVFGILNSLIDTVIEMQGALGESLVNGRIDYSMVINKPSVNGVELDGDKSSEDLAIEIGSEVSGRLSGFESRVSDTEVANADLDDRADALESFKNTYKTKVDTLESGRVADQSRISTLESHRTNDAANITQLQNRVNAVDTSISSLNIQQGANSTLITQQVQTMDDVNDIIVTKINEIITRTNLIADAACNAGQSNVCVQPVQQLDLEND